ncbi:hypothetical protein [Limosilactobacillus reuteri]|uniref:hypothetical protein n=1 Tax=Limosilactobacillus reuteri TaxID=1598 RepID=UPI00207C70A1|nr:hypothetical protein [Limosilactobacillus reuteri]MCO1498221.1 hypothetical protein [Limosilactobacillus reuteri]
MRRKEQSMTVNKRWHKTAIIGTGGAIGATLIVRGAPPLAAWIEDELTKLMRW